MPTRVRQGRQAHRPIAAPPSRRSRLLKRTRPLPGRATHNELLCTLQGIHGRGDNREAVVELQLARRQNLQVLCVTGIWRQVGETASEQWRDALPALAAELTPVGPDTGTGGTGVHGGARTRGGGGRAGRRAATRVGEGGNERQMI